MGDRFQAIHSLARWLEGLPHDHGAVVRYDWFAGGLSWSDERPADEAIERMPAGLLQALRPVIRFRASLIAGTPEERYRAHWEEARRSFPNWPGFLPDRSDAKWRQTQAELEAKADCDFEALDQKYQAVQPAPSASPVDKAVGRQ